ncbi:MAG: ATP synthase F0 subunit C [Bryobacteraceae bacterium]|nr:ATP synthase F0 subunit C [Bryobacteraceae bacterium]
MKIKMLVVLAVMFLFVVPTFAQSGGSSSSAPLVPSVVGLGLAAGLAAMGQGKAVASAAEGIARNPGAGGAIRTLALIGLAFMESLVLFTFLKTN